MLAYIATLAVAGYAVIGWIIAYIVIRGRRREIEADIAKLNYGMRDGNNAGDAMRQIVAAHRKAQEEYRHVSRNEWIVLIVGLAGAIALLAYQRFA